MFTFFTPPDASSPSGKEGKPVENGVLVNEGRGKLIHRCVVWFFSFPLFHPVTQLWTKSNLVFMVFVREKYIILDPAAWES